MPCCVLRSTGEEADKPLQVVYAIADCPGLRRTGKPCQSQKQADQLEAFLRRDRTPGLSPRPGSLMRCALLRLGPQRHRFVWSHHHLLMDGWCNALLIKEVLACYRAQRQGQTLTLQPPRPYRDYILWLQQQDQQAAQAYWQKKLWQASPLPPRWALTVCDSPLLPQSTASSG